MTTPDEKTLTMLTKLFEEEFGPIGDRQVLYVHAPGRSEISGNHTDHEGGHVIAGSLDVAVDGIAVATDSNKIRVADEGYPTFEITLDTLDVQESEKGTSASLVRGMAHEIAALGVEPQGFDFAFTCSVPSGGGLSSSAAVEAAYGRAMEALWGAPAIEPVALAQMSQRTENNYYGKPCGLMDQAAVCLGGLAFANAFLGVNHSMAHKLGGEYHIPHGRANAILLPYVIKYNATKPTKFAAFPKYKEYVADERYAKIARRVGLCNASTPTDKAVDCLIEAIVKLMKATDRPLSVQACGVSEAEFMSKVNELSYKAFEDQCTTANPVYPLVSEIEDLYKKAYYGK